MSHAVSVDHGLGGDRPGPLLRRGSRSSFTADEIEHEAGEDWLKFYVNPFSGMGEAMLTEPVQLSQESLKKLPANIVKPMYERPLGDPAFVENFICHLGVGGFHRSHEAVYTDDLLNSGMQPRWAICGMGLMEWDAKMYLTLKSQDYLYTLLSRGHNQQQARVIGSIVDFVHAPEGHAAAIARLAHPSTKIVSLTVTEKGYCQDVAGNLDTAHNAFVKADLEGDLQRPKTAIGMVVAALRARRLAGTPSFTVLSCDNLPENGDKAKHVVLQMAGLVDPDLRRWVEGNTTFPNTMVDRITPVTEQEHIDILARDYMVRDGWPVIAEDFSQWVVEDNFCFGCPDWDQVGALLVKDVRPYEFMKLRLLNGGHSALSFMGLMCGYHYVDDAMADPSICSFVQAFFGEVERTLRPVPGVDLSAYQRKLVERFSNPYIKDKLARLAEDGSQKVLNTMRDAIAELTKQGQPTTVLALANAAFVRYMVGEDEDGLLFTIKDPQATRLGELAREATADKENPGPEKFLQAIFGAEITALEHFVKQVRDHLRRILKQGTKAALEETIAALGN
ncbi:unnamed protein product [Phaeothamnion confervicola]